MLLHAFALVVFCFSAFAQTSPATKAAELRQLLSTAPHLSVQQSVLSGKIPNLGTVSSLAVARDGTIYILQRGDKADPIIALDSEGRTLRSWGKGMFTVPHSIRIDPQNNIWTVDAGSSVLLKFSSEGKKLGEIVVGETATADQCAFPTLCGTTDVAFGPNGRIFISDGYGNARILEYNRDGRRVKAWGSSGAGPGQFQIPHGIAVDNRVIYVADRTNARIQRFDLDGHFLGEWTHVGRPYALKLTNGTLWISGTTLDTPRGAPIVLKVDTSTGKILSQSEASGPHAIDVGSAEDFFTTGCCGGTDPLTFSWFRSAR